MEAWFARSHVLSALSSAEQEQVAGRMHQHVFRRGEVVVRQGEPGQSLHVVLEGHFKVVVGAESGDELLLTIVGPGQLFGEVALLDGGLRSATVVALEAGRTASLSRTEFLDLLRRSPSVLEGVLAGLARLVRHQADELSNLVGLDVTARLAKRLLELTARHGREREGAVEIGLTVTQEELGAMVGATRVTVNQLLAAFEDQGIIHRRGRRIAVSRADLLQQLISG
jgi:CRP-like cAMP-binding protein